MNSCMKSTVVAGLSLLLCACQSSKPPAPPYAAPVVEDYHGVQVIDPYRHLENLKDPDVDQWYRAQGRLARETLDNIPGRSMVLGKLREFDSRKSDTVAHLVVTESDHHFYLKRTPEEDVAKLYYRKGFAGAEQMLFDPDTYEPGAKNVITGISAPDDGSKVLVGLSVGGSENVTLLIMDVASRQLFPERIDRCMTTFASWTEDGSGFFYNRLISADVHDPERFKDSKAMFHRVGTEPETDHEVFSREKCPELGIRPEQIPIAQYEKRSGRLYGMLFDADRRFVVFDAAMINAQFPVESISWRPLIKAEDNVVDMIPTDQALYLRSFDHAPRFKILRVPLDVTDLAEAEEVVPESPDGILSGFAVTSDGLYYALTRNGVQAELFFVPKGETGRGRPVPLPLAAGSISLASRSYNSPDLWAEISGWTTDSRRYRYVPDTGEFTPEQLSTLPDYPEFSELEVEELMVHSQDQTLVPLSIIRLRSTPRDGKAPVMLFGYGAYGISMTPWFNPAFLVWTLHGGIFAVAHVRGGGELGDAWHMGGFKETKPNTWKDMIACADYLVRENYTSRSKLVMFGASAGGITVGRAVTERPDLCAAAIPAVGVMNPVRLEATPNGPPNFAEFGNARDPDEFHAVFEMDSYLKIRDGARYPAMLITAGYNDPRVIAWQPGKFAARIQAANRSRKPLLFLVDYETGHGLADTRTKELESVTDFTAFGLWQAGHPEFQPRRRP
jgi:prolyl oligopeptidase